MPDSFVMPWMLDSCQLGFPGEAKMPSAEIDEFVRILVTEVRDEAIACCDIELQPQANGPVAKRWRNKLGSGSCNELAAEMIPDCVDLALGALLDAIDNGLLRLSFVATTGKVVDLTEEGMGELTGWYMGGEWISKYSQQRFVDDFGDLKGFFDDQTDEEE